MNRKRLLQNIGLILKQGAGARAKYLRDKGIFAEVGDNVSYQPRIVPLYPELIKLHNNIVIAAGVQFITHDKADNVLNRLGIGFFPERIGCIEIMDNVFVGARTIIMNNVRIGENVIVGAGSIVTKDLENGGVYAGIPAKRIGSFSEFVKKREKDSNGEYSYPYIRKNQNITVGEITKAWECFKAQRE